MSGGERWWDNRTRLQCYAIGIVLGWFSGFCFGMGLSG